MELNVQKDTVTTVGQLIDTRQELPIETEILIPDYLPEVFKIVKSFVHLVVLQKQIIQGRLAIEGYFRVEVFYQGEQAALCSIEQKVPFLRQIDLKQGEWTQNFIEVTGEVQYINCRAVNQRRLDVRGAYNIYAQILAATQQEVITAVSGQGLQQKQEVIPTVTLAVSPDKQFTVEEEIVFDTPPSSILHTESMVSIEDVKLVSDKAVVKGEISSIILYRGEDNALQHSEKKLPFNQIVELQGANENSECQVTVTPIGCTISSQGEGEAQLQLAVTCIINVKAVSKQDVLLVVDSFSTQKETELEMQDITSEVLLDNVQITLTANAQGKLPDADVEVLECFVSCTAPQLIQLENESFTKVGGKATAHLFCVNTLGEIECLDKACEYVLPKKYEIPMQKIEGTLTVQCTDAQVSKNKDDASVEMTLEISGILMEKNKISVLKKVECTQDLHDDSDVALRIYYAETGEAVFDIAKRYHASPVHIANLAGIETKVLSRNQRLLIPLSE